MFPDLCGNKDKGFSLQGIYPKCQMSTLVPFLHVDNIQFFILIQAYLVLESFRTFPSWDQYGIQCLLNPYCLFKKFSPTSIYKPIDILFYTPETNVFNVYLSLQYYVWYLGSNYCPLSPELLTPPLNSSKNHCCFRPLSSLESLLFRHHPPPVTLFLLPFSVNHRRLVHRIYKRINHYIHLV